MTERVLLIDDDRHVGELLLSQFAAAGVHAEVAEDGLSAIEKLRSQRYGAVILDPAIRNGLNGYAVLNFIELEQPELMTHLFLLTAMSQYTITWTAPSLLPRLFRKPADTATLAGTVLKTFVTRRHRSSSTRSVLVIEDDRVAASLLCRLTEELGYQVTMVHSGKDALHSLASHCYAAILLDLVLPDIDGFAILKYLEETAPILLSRVIVTTGIPERYSSSVDGRVCALLQKPIDPRQLADALQRCEEPVAGFEPGGEFPNITRVARDHV